MKVLLFFALVMSAPFCFADTKDYYQLLGVAPTATGEELKAARKKLVVELHPDRNKDPEAGKKLAEVLEAYDVLSNTFRRLEYDRKRKAAQMGLGSRAGGASTRGPVWSSQTSRDSTGNKPKKSAEKATGANQQWAQSDYDLRGRNTRTQGANTSANNARAKARSASGPSGENLTFKDVLQRSERYESWQDGIRARAMRSSEELRLIGLAHYAQVGASYKLGVNGEVLAWLGLAASLLTLGDTSPLVSMAALAASPIFWQTFAYYSTRGSVQKAVDRIHLFKTDILATPTVEPIINALMAYDFVAQTLAQHFNAFGPSRTRFRRLERAWLFKLIHNDPLVIKGSIVRALQSSNQTEQDDFFSDLSARGKKTWLKPLRELVDDLREQDMLRQRAYQKLMELEGRSRFASVTNLVRSKAAWACELALAHYETLTTSATGQREFFKSQSRKRAGGWHF